MIFDVRIRHRGGANRSARVRPILYLAFAQAWFRDDVNFKGRQTASWWRDFSSTAARKLFMRLDQARYVERLEAIAERHGEDLVALRAPLSYRAVNMRLEK